MHRIALLFFIVIALTFSALAQSNDSINIYKRLGNDASRSLQNRIEAAEKGRIYAKQKKDTFHFFLFSCIKGQHLFSMGEYFQADQLMEKLLREAETAFPKEKDSLWLDLYHSLLICQGQCKVYIGEHEEALNIFNQLIRENKKDSNSIVVGQGYAGSAMLFSIEGKTDIAIQYYEKSLAIFLSKKDTMRQYLMYCNLGGCYAHQGDFKKALQQFLKAYNCLVEKKYEGDQNAYIHFWLGIAYNGLGQKDLAEKYFQESLNLANRMDMHHLKSYIYINYSSLLIQQERYEQAKRICLDGLARHNPNGSKQLIINLYTNLSDIAIYQKNYKEGYDYLLKSYFLLDSVKKNETDKKLKYIQLKFESYKETQDHLMMEKDMLLAENKIIQRNLWIFFFIVICLVLSLSIIWLIRRILKQCRVNNLMKSRLDQAMESSHARIEDIKDVLNKEINTKNQELLSHSLYSAKTQSLTDEVLEKLKALKVQFNLKSREKLLISEIESLMEEFSSDNNWQEFDIYFRQLKNDFFEKLDARFPMLTQNEKRLCALLSLNLSSKEIASITHRTIRSVGMAKTRLRKKIGLEDGEDLYQVFLRL